MNQPTYLINIRLVYNFTCYIYFLFMEDSILVVTAHMRFVSLRSVH